MLHDMANNTQNSSNGALVFIAWSSLEHRSNNSKNESSGTILKQIKSYIRAAGTSTQCYVRYIISSKVFLVSTYLFEAPALDKCAQSMV